jgi:pathogenesis-related protein 1
MNMKITLLFLFLMQIFIAGNTQNVPEKTGSKVSVKDAREALDFHNKVRKEVNVDPLEWSVELAAYAQEWADFLANKNSCRIAHRVMLGKNTKMAGENVFMGMGMSFNALYASKTWYREKKNYDPADSPNSGFQNTGHYTQMVWRKTVKVGIGIAVCKSGATIIVANYDPAGNFIGEKPF